MKTYTGNPQTEDGYVRIANELYDAILATDINKTELKIILFLIRVTYGWNRKEINVSATDIAKAIGIDRSNALKGLDHLAQLNMISKITSSNKKFSTIALNKRYMTWEGSIFSLEIFNSLLLMQTVNKRVEVKITDNGSVLNPPLTSIENPGHIENTHYVDVPSTTHMEVNTHQTEEEFPELDSDLENAPVHNTKIYKDKVMQNQVERSKLARNPSLSPTPPGTELNLAPSEKLDWPLNKELLLEFNKKTQELDFVNKKGKKFDRPLGFSLMKKELNKMVDAWGVLKVAKAFKDVLDSGMIFYKFSDIKYVDVNLGFLFVLLRDTKKINTVPTKRVTSGAVTIDELIKMAPTDFILAASNKRVADPDVTNSLVRAINNNLFTNLDERYKGMLNMALEHKSKPALKMLASIMSLELNCGIDAEAAISAFIAKDDIKLKKVLDELTSENTDKVKWFFNYATPK